MRSLLIIGTLYIACCLASLFAAFWTSAQGDLGEK